MTVTASPRETTFAFLALFGGAIAIGMSPLFVRFADVGPFASAFWRVALALPVLWLWHLHEDRTHPPTTRTRGLASWPVMIPAGLFFAGDLIFWHLSILNTTIANATLFANCSAIIVAIGGWLILGERMTRTFVIGLAVALVGMPMVVGASYEVDPSHVLGDFYGLVTAFFFASYMLSVRSVRASISPGTLMFRSGVITAIALLITALVMDDPLLPGSLQGWLVLLGLALVSHAGGQGLLAYALGHVPAALGSLVILIEPLAAAILGWLILNEAVTPLQAAGGAVILTGIIIARIKRKDPARDLA